MTTNNAQNTVKNGYEGWSFFHANADRTVHTNEQMLHFGGIVCPECKVEREAEDLLTVSADRGKEIIGEILETANKAFGRHEHNGPEWECGRGDCGVFCWGCIAVHNTEVHRAEIMAELNS